MSTNVSRSVYIKFPGKCVYQPHRRNNFIYVLNAVVLKFWRKKFAAHLELVQLQLIRSCLYFSLQDLQRLRLHSFTQYSEVYLVPC